MSCFSINLVTIALIYYYLSSICYKHRTRVILLNFRWFLKISKFQYSSCANRQNWQIQRFCNFVMKAQIHGQTIICFYQICLMNKTDAGNRSSFGGSPAACKQQKMICKIHCFVGKKLFMIEYARKCNLFIFHQHQCHASHIGSFLWKANNSWLT